MIPVDRNVSLPEPTSGDSGLKKLIAKDDLYTSLDPATQKEVDTYLDGSHKYIESQAKKIVWDPLNKSGACEENQEFFIGMVVRCKALLEKTKGKSNEEIDDLLRHLSAYLEHLPLQERMPFLYALRGLTENLQTPFQQTMKELEHKVINAFSNGDKEKLHQLIKEKLNVYSAKQNDVTEEELGELRYHLEVFIPLHNLPKAAFFLRELTVGAENRTSPFQKQIGAVQDALVNDIPMTKLLEGAKSAVEDAATFDEKDSLEILLYSRLVDESKKQNSPHIQPLVDAMSRLIKTYPVETQKKVLDLYKKEPSSTVIKALVGELSKNGPAPAAKGDELKTLIEQEPLYKQLKPTERIVVNRFVQGLDAKAKGFVPITEETLKSRLQCIQELDEYTSPTKDTPMHKLMDTLRAKLVQDIVEKITPQECDKWSQAMTTETPQNFDFAHKKLFDGIMVEKLRDLCESGSKDTLILIKAIERLIRSYPLEQQKEVLALYKVEAAASEGIYKQSLESILKRFSIRK